MCFDSSSPLRHLSASWESEHDRRRYVDILSRDEAWESAGAADIISSLISGKLCSGKMIPRCSSNDSLSFLSATVTSVSSCCAWRGKDEDKTG